MIRSGSGVDYLGSSPVVEGHVENQPVVVLGQLDGVHHSGAEVLRESLQLPDVAQLHASFMQIPDLALENLLQDPHQALHFFARPEPILGRERIDGDDLDPKLAAGLQDPSDVLGSSAVAFDSGQTVLSRPSAVSVHDDADVIWYG
jgi:hypothetical protein